MMKSNNQSRKQFIKTVIAASSGAALINPARLFAKTNCDNSEPHISIFSKHLQFLNYENMAESAKEIGFNGVDLTVRPNGHVTPESVEENLPHAQQALTKYGLTPHLFTSNVWDATNPLEQKVLKTASAEGFKYYRTGWLKYTSEQDIEKELRNYNAKAKQLAILNEKLGLTGSYQNHAGVSVGSPVWDIKTLLNSISPEHLGVQYDIRHATVEGANSWKLGFELIKPQINTIVLKDFKWGKVNGKWTTINTPLGQGMIDFERYFRLLKQNQINVPISMHMEYDLGGAEMGRTKIDLPQKTVFKLMKQDLQFIRETWDRA